VELAFWDIQIVNARRNSVSIDQVAGSQQNVKRLEKRRNARMRIHLFTVVRKILGSKHLSRPHIGFTRDISINGIYFYTRMKIKRGDSLCLTVHVVSGASSGGPPPKLEGDGLIVRIDRIHKEFPIAKMNGVAVRFTSELAVTF
jgi:hypothetical protein